MGLLAALFFTIELGCGADAQPPVTKNGPERSRDVVITIVYDNNPLDKRLKTAWGFACVIEGLRETILFDTGGEGKLLLANMATAGFKPEQMDSIVLSHIHADHTGGLGAFLETNSKVKVFAPKAFPADFKQAVRQPGAKLVETEGPSKVCDRAWTTGVLKQGIEEQGLYLETPEGLVVITGCAHPGIVHLAEAARRHGKMPVYAVLGGFHMAGASANKVNALIRNLREIGVQQVAPCHCSGDNTRRLMKEAFGEEYLPSGVGARLVFPGQQRSEDR